MVLCCGQICGLAESQALLRARWRLSDACSGHESEKSAAAWDEVLREEAAVFAVGFFVDGLGEPRVADEVLQRKKFAAEVNRVSAGSFFLRRVVRESVERGRGSMGK